MLRFSTVSAALELFLIAALGCQEIVAATKPATGAIAPGEVPEFVIAKFDRPEDLGKVAYNKQKFDLSIGPCKPHDSQKALKCTLVKAGNPELSFKTATKVVPQDWSDYEVFSFTVWAMQNIKVKFVITFLDGPRYFERSFNLQKGLALIQVPIKDVVEKKLDVKSIKWCELIPVDQPKGVTFWLADLRLGPQLPDQVEFIPYNERYDWVTTLDFSTPHLPMARNLAGGPLPVFMLTSVSQGREVAEMMERMDLKVSQLTWDQAWAPTRGSVIFI